MGNKQDKGNYIPSHNGHFGQDFLLVQTLKPTYLPGETVEGTIYLRLTQPCQAKSLVVTFKGKESAAFRDFVTEEIKQEEGNADKKQ